MALSKLRDHFDCTHEFAAVESPCEELVEVLAKSHGFKKNFGRLENGSIPANKHNGGYVVAYSPVGSTWTILDAVRSRYIAAIDRATKKLKTQAIGAGYCHNTCSFGYWHTRNGRTIELYSNSDPEFPEVCIGEAKQKGWQTSSSGGVVFHTKRDISVDLETANGFDLFSALSDELGVDIPREQWELEEDPLRVEQYSWGGRPPSPVSSAFLLYL